MEITIAFCTVVKNRAFHLKMTLLKNIHDNRDYKLCTFIVLDYNSEDDLEIWIRENCREYIVSGKLVYYKTLQPQTFHRSHSRNVAFNLAEAEIVVNVDADNFLGKGFATHINERYKNDKNKCLVVDYTSKELHYFKGSMGRICVRKKDFVLIRGFDEQMAGYGFEDMDFIYRLEKAGLKKEFIHNSGFLQTIPHDDVKRISDEDLYKNFQHVLIKYVSYDCTEILFLAKNNTCQYGTVLDNLNHDTQNRNNIFSPMPKYAFGLVQDDWITGQWRFVESKTLNVNFPDSCLTLQSDDAKFEFKQEDKEEIRFYSVTDPYVINTLLKFHPEIKNRSRMQRNLNSENKINATGFGRAIVYKNFNYQQAITL